MTDCRTRPGTECVIENNHCLNCGREVIGINGVDPRNGGPGATPPTLTGNDPPPDAPDQKQLAPLTDDDQCDPGAVPASRQHPSLLGSETLPTDAPVAPPGGVLVDHAKEKPDELFEPTGKSAVPWLTSTGKPPQSTPWVVQPKDGGAPAPAPIQSIPLVRCPTCKTDRVHRYGRSKTSDGKPGNVHYYQCQNCTDARTGYALTRFKVLHT